MSDHILKALKESLADGMREVTKLPGSEAAVSALAKTMLLLVEEYERGIASCAILGRVTLAGEHPGHRELGVGLHVPGAAPGVDLFFPTSANTAERVKHFLGSNVELAVDVFRPVTKAQVHAEGTVSFDGQKLEGHKAELVETFMRRAERGCIAPNFEGNTHALALLLPDGTGVVLPQTMEQWAGLHRHIGYLLKGKLKITGPELNS